MAMVPMVPRAKTEKNLRSQVSLRKGCRPCCSLATQTNRFIFCWSGPDVFGPVNAFHTRKVKTVSWEHREVNGPGI